MQQLFVTAVVDDNHEHFRTEIPMFHLLRANVTFSNIFALDNPVPGVTAINDEIATACVMDETIFDFESPPPGYSVEGNICRVLSTVYRDVLVVTQPVSISKSGDEKWSALDLLLKLSASLVANQPRKMFVTNIHLDLTSSQEMMVEGCGMKMTSWHSWPSNSICWRMGVIK